MNRITIATILCVMLAMTSCKRSNTVHDIISRAEILRMNPELHKVLDKYKNDSLKYEAALFLIDNLPYHEGVVYSDLTPMYHTYELFGTGKFTPEQAKDSVTRKFGTWFFNSVNYRNDTYIDPDFLIDNIDWAFKVWQKQPWGKNIPFEQFCEYVLPYRIGNEELYPWREKIYKQFMPILEEAMKDTLITEPKQAAHVVFDSLLRAPFHFTELIATEVRVGPRIVDTRGGSCLDLTDMMVYIMRALGIPCGIEVLPTRGNNNAPHYWNFIVDTDGTTYYYSMFYWWHRLLKAEVYGDVYGKVYRDRFSLNKALMEEMNMPQDSLHPFFRYPCIEDVTNLYATDKGWTLEIPKSRILESKNIGQGEMLYLCMSKRHTWIPVDWNIYDGENAKFENCHGGTVYCLGRYNAHADKLEMLSDPFSVDLETGEMYFFTPSNEKHDVTLLSKFGMIGEYFLERMKGGAFEGSNNANFSNADTIYHIKEAPCRLCTTVKVSNPQAYRYVRYIGPEEGYGNTSEVEFYSAKNLETPLKGTVIGPKEGAQGDHSYFNVFDGKTDTSYDHPKGHGGWAGLKLDKPERIGKIVYTPRNRDNFVRKDDVYELFVCIDGNWVPQGIQPATSDSLVYHDIPENTLLLLRNYTRGAAERLFEYKEGKQVYW